MKWGFASFLDGLLLVLLFLCVVFLAFSELVYRFFVRRGAFGFRGRGGAMSIPGSRMRFFGLIPILVMTST